ncbi:hypothetical protein MHTCC0001_27510 [Flavobacteriaceae bacterium MHTCC 0001]
MMKNTIKALAILLVIFLISNCVKEDIEKTTFNDTVNVDAETVNLEQAKIFFEKGNKTKKNAMYARGGCYGKSINGTSFKATPNWLSFKQSPIYYTDALLSIVDTDVNRHGNFSSKLYFIKIDGEIKNVVFTVFNKKVDDKGDILNAVVLFNETNGSFIDAFKIENGAFTKRLVPKKHKVEKAAFLMLQSSNDDFIHEWIWCDGGAGGQLDEVDLGTIQSSNGNSYDDYISIATQNTQNPDRTYNASSGGGSMSNSSLISGSGAILLNELRPVDDETYCPNGYIKDDLGNCIAQIIIEAPDDEITDMEKFLDCINPRQNATITIYADQPITNSKIPVTKDGDVGHAFISISQNGNTLSFGFYPKQKAKAFTLADGSIGNNQNHGYDVSISFSITSAVLSNIIDFAKQIPEKYNITTYNCTDYVIDISNFASLNLPDCNAIYPGLTGIGGSSPSVLGEYLRDLPDSDDYTINRVSGRAPLQSGDCNN